VTELGRRFSEVAELYDEVRPDYPDELYDVIASVVGPWPGRRVLDIAAGTGIATRQLRSRGADVVAVDPGEPMLRRLRRVTPDAPVVAATGEALPVRTASVDLATCATGWHWMDTALTLAQLQVVLRPDGHIALWWANNRFGDGIEWEAAQQTVYERWGLLRGSVPDRGTGPRDAAADLRRRGLEVVVEQLMEWQREVSRETHLAVLATHSNRLGLPAADRDRLLDELAAALEPWAVVTERLSGPLVVARRGRGLPVA
jgi:SAM-dependent methyltransferase